MTDEMKKEVSEIEKALKPVVRDESTYLDLMDSSRFEHLQRVARVFAASKLVPKHFQGNVADCTIACQMAMRLDVDPMMLMQNMYVIYGRPGMEAKLVIALMNSRGPFTGPVQFRLEGEGKNRKCTAYATHKVSGQVCSSTVDWAMVEAEGWDQDKKNPDTGKITKSKWNTITDQMFCYRSASFLCNLHCPEVKMGLKTADELHDIGETIDVTPEAPLTMPKSVKEAESGESGETEGKTEEQPPRRQADVGGGKGKGRKANSVSDPKGKTSVERGGDGDGSRAGGGVEGSESLFSDPSPEEQDEILRQERGQYGPP